MMRPTADALRVDGVSKVFGSLVALSGIDLTVPTGCMVLMAGPNGAGKSTLLRLLAGLGRPTEGSVHINGQDPARDAPVRCQIGLLSHHTMLYEDLTASENLRVAARLHGLPGCAAEAALATAGLAGRGSDRVHTFSRGMKQRLALARARLHNPSILLLDEPFTGLDQGATEWLTEQLRLVLESGCTGILVTHQMEEAVRIADHLIILRGGRICFDAACKRGDLEGLNATYRRFEEADL